MRYCDGFQAEGPKDFWVAFPVCNDVWTELKKTWTMFLRIRNLKLTRLILVSITACAWTVAKGYAIVMLECTGVRQRYVSDTCLQVSTNFLDEPPIWKKWNPESRKPDQSKGNQRYGQTSHARVQPTSHWSWKTNAFRLEKIIDRKFMSADHNCCALQALANRNLKLGLHFRFGKHDN